MTLKQLKLNSLHVLMQFKMLFSYMTVKCLQLHYSATLHNWYYVLQELLKERFLSSLPRQRPGHWLMCNKQVNSYVMGGEIPIKWGKHFHLNYSKRKKIDSSYMPTLLIHTMRSTYTSYLLSYVVFSVEFLSNIVKRKFNVLILILQEILNKEFNIQENLGFFLVQ